MPVRQIQTTGTPPALGADSGPSIERLDPARIVSCGSRHRDHPSKLAVDEQHAGDVSDAREYDFPGGLIKAGDRDRSTPGRAQAPMDVVESRQPESHACVVELFAGQLETAIDLGLGTPPPSSATRSMASVRICISMRMPRGPTTVVWIER